MSEKKIFFTYPKGVINWMNVKMMKFMNKDNFFANDNNNKGSVITNIL